VCLNLSFFDTAVQNFAEYANGIAGNAALKFEPILRFASFPDLDHAMKAPFLDHQKDHDEIRTILKFLKNKGVTDIIELQVLDRLYSPHRDEIIQDSITDFMVRKLNWRKVDQYLGEFPKQSKLETLHLYSSGNRAVISHWLSKDGGLRNFTNVCSKSLADFENSRLTNHHE
jgi:hypothetical protein